MPVIKAVPTVSVLRADGGPQLAAVQFHLINTVILFLAREGFRRGCLRPPSVRSLQMTYIPFGAAMHSHIAYVNVPPCKTLSSSSTARKAHGRRGFHCV